MKIIILILILLTSSCSNISDKQKIDYINKSNKILITPTQDDLEECKELPIFSGENFGDLYLYTIELSKIYYECSNKAKINQDFVILFKNSIK